MASNKVRVVIPENVTEYLLLVKNIVEKEDSLAPNGTLSPAELQTLKDLGITAYKADVEKSAAEKKSE